MEELFGRLWREYRTRVPYARACEDWLTSRGRPFRNDHVAFRTFAVQRPWLGIAAVARPFEAAGWRAAGCYSFPDKKLSSVHFEPPSPELPKLFVSELRLWELTPASRRIALKYAARARPGLSDRELASRPSAARLARLFGPLWPAPERRDVEALERESQFGAWVLLHGHSVNHFTAAVTDIEDVAAGLKAAGVPMKPEIEGAPGSKLRQTSTQSVVLPTAMRERGKAVRRPWTYAYFELAERRGFEGFLGGQATNLFEMTRRS